MNRSSLKVFCRLGLTVLGCWSVIGCASDDDAAPASPPAKEHIEIAGTWASSFGGTETVDDTSWTTTYGSVTIVEYDNDERYAVVQDTGPAASFPGTFGYDVWTKPTNGSFYYCPVNFDCPTPDAAIYGDDIHAGCYPPQFDVSDPSRGCGVLDLAWTTLSKP